MLKNTEDTEYPIYKQHKSPDGHVWVEFVSKGRAKCVHKTGKRSAWPLNQLTTCAYHTDSIWEDWDGIPPYQRKIKTYKIKD